MKITRSLAIAALLVGAYVQAAEKSIPKYLTDISVTVRAKGEYSRSEGSGTLFKRKFGDKDVLLTWTAAHVIRHLRSTREEISGGKPFKIVEFGNPSLVRKLRNPKNGRIVGEMVVDAKVLKYSDAETGHDLALLQVLAEDFEAEETTKFHPKDGDLIPVGEHLWHAGSLLGSDGAGSITDGRLSAHGRLLNGKITLTQATVVAFPGSSGGGCFTDDGLYCGMLVRGTSTQGFNLLVPIKRMWSFATSAKMEWAMDPTVKVTQKEVDAMPIEDLGIKGIGKIDTKSYPYLIREVKFKKEE